ncbi:MAG: acetyl-CoA carboxylase biotin carboxylase subunit [Bradyrhizobiaceae bacterium]|nr:acetyl-CoA carboxylase biotin carboxylase subunit [Bradyrhizobiaceae bacterium]
MALSRVLIANRGEIAVRLIRACQDLGLATVVAVSEADRDSLPAQLADRAVCIGPARSSDSYLNPKAIVAAALGTQCDAVHPGYGFLAESPSLADACAAAGLTFVGPRAEHLHSMGNKIEARSLARSLGVPTLPGSDRIQSAQEAMEVAGRVGFPVMIKAAAGGGGRGMKVITRAEDLPQAIVSAAAEAGAAFGDSTLYIEHYVANARHIEVQVLGDGAGHVIHLGERDCSLQRRHQKLIEEAPAPGIPAALREQIHAAAIRLVGHMNYLSAGTVEFLFDCDTREFYFLEMNTRIQVEHPVTEMLTGVDLVAEQLRIAGGEGLRFSQRDIGFYGHVVECRLTAEQPEHDFRPNAGKITQWDPPAGPNIRLDTHCYAGYSVPIFYDSLLAKLIVHGVDRPDALARASRALRRFRIGGVGTNAAFAAFVLDSPEFSEGRLDTRLAETLIARFVRQESATPTGADRI